MYTLAIGRSQNIDEAKPEKTYLNCKRIFVKKEKILCQMVDNHFQDCQESPSIMYIYKCPVCPFESKNQREFIRHCSLDERKVQKWLEGKQFEDVTVQVTFFENGTQITTQTQVRKVEIHGI